jgi:glycosyltransferase involved in cell wall biosynthesis
MEPRDGRDMNTPAYISQPLQRPVILMISDYYLPGFESGGAMRTLVNMVDRLQDEFDFRIITRDHDGRKDLTPYDSVKLGEWNTVRGAEVYYLTKTQVSAKVLKLLIRETAPAAIYLNSFFSLLTVSVLLLRRFRKIGPVPVILAPEGELSPGGLAIKYLKKTAYLAFARMSGLLGGLIWKAASEPEKEDINRNFGPLENVFIAPNLPPRGSDVDSTPGGIKKAAGSVSFVFLSRIARKKNLNWFIELLLQIEGDIRLDVYGPMEDESYFAATRELVAKLGEGIRVKFFGPLDHTKVASVLPGYHFFLLPTLGENFGHVFIEALEAGLPLVTSDRTPWRDLESSGIGWDTPLESPESWLAVIDRCIQMDEAEHAEMSRRARRFVLDWLNDPELERSNREVLCFAVDRQKP